MHRTHVNTKHIATKKKKAKLIKKKSIHFDNLFENVLSWAYALCVLWVIFNRIIKILPIIQFALFLRFSLALLFISLKVVRIQFIFIVLRFAQDSCLTHPKNQSLRCQNFKCFQDRVVSMINCCREYRK